MLLQKTGILSRKAGALQSIGCSCSGGSKLKERVHAGETAEELLAAEGGDCPCSQPLSTLELGGEAASMKPSKSSTTMGLPQVSEKLGVASMSSAIPPASDSLSLPDMSSFNGGGSAFGSGGSAFGEASGGAFGS